MLEDEELKAKLKERGYDVPILVIRCWVKNHYGVRFGRKHVERWVLHQPGTVGRRPKFPQFIAPFDINIRRRIERQNEDIRSTPRLPR